MKFRLVIDETAEEEITATVHTRSPLIDRIEALVLQHSGADRIPAVWENEMIMLPFSEIACISVLDGKTYAIDSQNRHCRLRQRLYELEAILPTPFFRINKSALANGQHLERFSTSFSGSVNAVFRCGYTEYVSRRCFAEIKRKYHIK